MLVSMSAANHKGHDVISHGHDKDEEEKGKPSVAHDGLRTRGDLTPGDSLDYLDENFAAVKRWNWQQVHKAERHRDGTNEEGERGNASRGRLGGHDRDAHDGA